LVFDDAVTADVACHGIKWEGDKLRTDGFGKKI
jgi:hypothetical protein